MENEDIKVAVVDDDEFPGQCMASYISKFKGVEVLFYAKSSKELIHQLNYKTPDVILLDLIMFSGMDGYETTEYLHLHHPEIKILILSVSISRNDLPKSKLIAEKLTVKGAHGFLSKNSNDEDIADAIHKVIKMGYCFNEYLSQETVLKLTKSHYLKPDSGNALFTQMDKKYLQLEFQGFGRNKAARMLGVNEKTYDRHWEHLFAKTKSKSEAEMILFVVENNICSKEFLSGEIENKTEI